jgi:hypothetical protein
MSQVIADKSAWDRVKVGRADRARSFSHSITIAPDENGGKPRRLLLTRDELIALAELSTEYVNQVL